MNIPVYKVVRLKSVNTISTIYVFYGISDDDEKNEEGIIK